MVKYTIPTLKMERERFCSLLNHDNLDELIISAFDNIGSLFETESFIFCNDGDVMILDKYSLSGLYKPRIIDWYKYTHIGRALQLYGFDDEAELILCLNEIHEELSELKEKHLKQGKHWY